MADYDIGKAFAKIEHEIMASMMRNMKRHRLEEIDEKKQWSMWQAEQLKALEGFKRENWEKYEKKFKDINESIDSIIREARAQGSMEQEIRILEAIKKGFSPKGLKKSAQTSGEFFKLNERKLDALIKATTDDMKKAETAVLRMSEDQYRKIIFDAQVYANTGAGTYEKAVDMATKDFLSRGINCIEYANGARHTITAYADMAIRTAAKRAYLQGEGEMRKEWGITTVIMKKRGNACPLCLPFVGKVMIDDVWSGGTARDGPYPLMSKAIAEGLYHPNCKDIHTTYFEGISAPPDSTFSVKELGQLKNDYRKEQRQQYAKRQADKFGRLSEFSLDEGNKKKYQRKAEAWKDNISNTAKGNAFEDITQKCLSKKICTPGTIKEMKTYEVNGKTYRVDGINIKQNNSKRELEVADILRKKLGYDVCLVPEVNGKYNNVPTPDYIINGRRWDLKELNQGTSKELLRNIAHKKKEQAENFIFDISGCKLNYDEINRQAECIFNTYYNTKHVDGIMIIEGDKIVRILKRK